MDRYFTGIIFSSLT